VAAFLSFLFPGLGQAAAGRPRRGLIVAIPAIAVCAVLAGVLIFARHQLLDSLFSDTALASFLLIDIVILLYRLWAIVDAYQIAGPVKAQMQFQAGFESKVQAKAPTARSG
jgi:TM2 domain-containing membrane protein YozV